MVGTELLIGAIKALVILVLVLNLTGLMLWFERKGAALIQDRIGANRAAIFGIGRRLGLPNFGLVNTLLADPIKLFTKEDFVPDGADRFLHTLAPFLALFPVLVTFAVVPMGDVPQNRLALDQSTGRQPQRRRPVYSGRAGRGRVWGRTGRMGLEQPLGPARRGSR